MTENLKTITWFNPATEDARQLGFSDTGCYTVHIVPVKQSIRHAALAIAAYETKAEALAHANKMSESWDIYSLR